MRLLIATLAVLAATMAIGAVPSVIPMPATHKEAAGTLRLARQCSVAFDDTVARAPILEALNAAGRVKFVAAAPGTTATLTFRRAAASAGKSAEAYKLIIAPTGIRVTGDHAGLYYGAQTLARLIENASATDNVGVQLDAMSIDDAPRYAWRGYMLDESRHFSGEATVKRTLDAMARYKLNRFHWHLTDSAGWRIEILKYPRLATIGGRGDETNVSDKAPARYYTQAQIRDIVAYARARHITIIPEIDMPGHADAAVRAYPEHDGGGYAHQGSSVKWPHFTFN